VLHLLRGANLPVDIEPHFENLLVAETDRGLVGAVGLERYETSALLRSL
jgi:hypothetical protein